MSARSKSGTEAPDISNSFRRNVWRHKNNFSSVDVRRFGSKSLCLNEMRSTLLKVNELASNWSVMILSHRMRWNALHNRQTKDCGGGVGKYFARTGMSGVMQL